MKKTTDEILRQYVDALPRDKERDLQKFRARAASRPVGYKNRGMCPVTTFSCALVAVLCVCALCALQLRSVWGGDPSLTDSNALEGTTLPTPSDVTLSDEDTGNPAPTPRVLTLADSLEPSIRICNGVLLSAGACLYGNADSECVVWRGNGDSFDSDSGDLSYSNTAGSGSTYEKILIEYGRLGSSLKLNTLLFYPSCLGSMGEYAFLGRILEPSVKASQISVAPLRDAGCSEGSRFGAVLQLNTLEPGAARSVVAYYVLNGYEVKELAFYGELEERTQWQGREIRYTLLPQDVDGLYVYRLCFQNEESYCCMRVQSLEQVSITELLTEIFG
ncbi:MAG: hypothetical protein IJX62_08405 [Clostridia bacterium]|nr:hypothetical protein [Clostridia bacterium]